MLVNNVIDFWPLQIYMWYNVPLFHFKVPVIIKISEDTTIDLPLEPLLYALAFGACLGGIYSSFHFNPPNAKAAFVQITILFKR